MRKLKVYVAGKVDPNSIFGTHNWRGNFCKILSKKTGIEIINLDPLKSHENFSFDRGNSQLIVGRDCFMIRASDLVIVNLTDDISVGGSHEMMIAKYYKKPLIGIAHKGGKFNKEEKEIMGKVYKNWIHPFVHVTCDEVVENIDQAAEAVKRFSAEDKPKVKDISVINDLLNCYEKEHHPNDTFLHFD